MIINRIFAPAKLFGGLLLHLLLDIHTEKNSAALILEHTDE
jgi:hypothetical protein